MNSKKTFQNCPQEAYTKFPNRYNDTIRHNLTDSQRDICEVVIRLTIGWQREQARIPNKTFVDKSGKSERSIITAKKQLLDMGLLIMLEPPRGTRAGLYKLDLYYNDPQKSIKAQMPQEQTIQNDLLEILDVEQKFNEIQVEVSTIEPEPQLLENPTIEEIPPVTVQGEQPIEASIPDSQQPKSPDPQIEKNQDSEKDCENPTTELTSALRIPGTDLDIYNINKQIENTPNKLNSQDTKTSIKDVCYKFTNLFPETKEDSTWKFIGWAVATYGQDKCTEKLEYLREYRKLHPVLNPKGLLRVALVNDYQPSKWITGMIKGKRKADLAYQQSQAMLANMEQARSNIDYEAGAAAVSNIIKMLEEKERQDG